MRFFPLQLLLVVVLFACSKSHNDPPKDENEKIKNNDAVKTIFITYPIYSSGFDGIHYLAAYDVSGKLKWKKDSVFTASNLTYSNGVLAVVTEKSSAAPNGSQSQFSLFGLEGETGNVLWSKQPSPYLHSNTIARNDTLFVSCGLSTSPYTPFIIGVNLKTGTELFKIPVRDNIPPRFFSLSGSIIYYIAHTEFGQTSMVAYDFKSNEEKWHVTIGVSNNGLPSSSDIVQNDNFLYVATGVDELVAIEKLTGSVRWSKDGRYLQPRFGNDLIFFGQIRVGVHAVNAGSGIPAWDWKSRDSNGLIENVFYGSDHLFFNYSNNGRMLTSLNAKTGKTEWERSAGTWPGQPLLVGDKLYFAELGTNSGKLLCLDANTGGILTSFLLPGSASNSNRKVYIVTESGKFVAPDRLYW